MLNTNFSPWPSFTQQEADAVAQTLLSNRVNYWTGEQGKLFEQNFAKFADCDYAVAIANGTLALELALRTLDVGVGDEVVVSPRSFIASVSCVVSVGATPIFADINPDSQNIDAKTIADVISPKTKAIICVHLAGLPCEMDAIMSLANSHNIKVIEDCAQAHGAKYNGKSVGSIGHIGAWSFCQDKIMTTGGEGGMITTNDEILYEKMWAYKDHGKSLQKIKNPQSGNTFQYNHNSFGSNYRLTEMQAAIGNIQLKKMPDWQQKRQENAIKIAKTVQNYSALRVIKTPEYMVNAYYKYYVFVDEKRLNSGWTSTRIRDEINTLGVPCYYGSCAEIYQEDAFINSNYKPKKPLKNAQNLAGKAMMFLVHPTLTTLEMNKTSQAIQTVMDRAQQ